MKKKLLVFTVFALALVSIQAQTRYIDEVFTDVTVTPNVEYAQNITVITGSPTNDTLYFDAYEPMGDTIAERPVILVAHTGSFLPSPTNGQATGSRTDTAIVDLCKMLAKRGYVAIAFTYRKGWNPQGTQEERTGTLLNAAYRGIQDARTLVRFFRDDYTNNSNAYGVDTNRIVMGGMGTGGYLGFGCATLDKYAEINLAKFLDPGSGLSYVDTSLSADLYGLLQRPLNVPSYVNESSEIHMAFNLGGAIGDSTWLEAGDVPLVSFHVPNDPFAPYKYGPVIVPTTQQFVVNVSGSHDVIRQAVGHGNQDILINSVFSDPYTMAANAVNDGWEGLFPFYRDSVESAPWEYWDSTIWKGVPHPTAGNFHLAGLATNPDMSRAKSMAYLDSVVNYLAPRMVCALNLPGCTAVGTVDPVKKEKVMVYPNPASDEFIVTTRDARNPIKAVSLIDMLGRTVKVIDNLTTDKLTVNPSGLKAGVYLVDIKFENGSISKRIVIE